MITVQVNRYVQAYLFGKTAWGIDMKIREIMETLQLNKLLDKVTERTTSSLTPWGTA